MNLLTVLAGAAIVIGIQTVFGRQDKVCQVIYEFVAQSRQQAGKPGSSGYEIYRRLPARARRQSIRRAREDGRRLLTKLEFCKPDELPKATSAGTPDRRATSPGRASARNVRDIPRDTRPAEIADAGRRYTAGHARPKGQSPASGSPPSDEAPKREAPPVPDPVEQLPGPGGPPPGQPVPPPREHGHERSALERVCDVVDQLATNAC